MPRTKLPYEACAMTWKDWTPAVSLQTDWDASIATGLNRKVRVSVAEIVTCKEDRGSDRTVSCRFRPVHEARPYLGGRRGGLCFGFCCGSRRFGGRNCFSGRNIHVRCPTTNLLRRGLHSLGTRRLIRRRCRGPVIHDPRLRSNARQRTRRRNNKRGNLDPAIIDKSQYDRLSSDNHHHVVEETGGPVWLRNGGGEGAASCGLAGEQVVPGFALDQGEAGSGGKCHVNALVKYTVLVHTLVNTDTKRPHADCLGRRNPDSFRRGGFDLGACFLDRLEQRLIIARLSQAAENRTDGRMWLKSC